MKAVPWAWAVTRGGMANGEEGQHPGGKYFSREFLAVRSPTEIGVTKIGGSRPWNQKAWQRTDLSTFWLIFKIRKADSLPGAVTNSAGFSQSGWLAFLTRTPKLKRPVGIQLLGINGSEKSFQTTAGMPAIFPKCFCATSLTHPSHFNFGVRAKRPRHSDRRGI